ncbi:hypothetical protein SELMODRAFT_417462 [Selaginella moellendorffii]|uniref:DDE Tnp4 domain-containing protein n=1 Tax=Selaginella moellendorffii TaxID=88036 RepID=D8S2A7_SELML|nr:hypothetical protein SELMODRAFT_417462 [Selaginella moellendorffii]
MKFRRAVLVDVRLGVTLYKLFKNTNYSDLSDKFGIGETTAHDIVVQTTAAIIKCLRYKIRFLETAAEVRAMVADFQQITKTRLPNVAGAIDCTHFEIIRPVGPDGGLRRSEKVLEYLCRLARECSRLMMTEAEYNQQHHLAQIVIKQAFGLLKMKFKCLDQKQRIKLKYLLNIIKSCCILHNFLIDVGETNINVEIKAWEKHIQALKEPKIFEDYKDPVVVEGEP